MATITWPDELPQQLIAEGYQETTFANVIVDQYEVGPSGMRRRSTASIFSVTGTMVMTTDEWETLLAFYADVLLQGSLPFGLPEQGNCGESPAGEWLVRFVDVPTRSSKDTDLWDVALSLEVLPQ